MLGVEIEEGIDGLVHISDLHWSKKIKHPSELYKKGDVVEAKVLGVSVEHERFSLGIKQLAPDPWKVVADRHPVGSKVKGQVTSVPDFGVFVRIDDRPGGLASLLGIFAAIGANLLEVQHVREGLDLHVRETGVRASFEVRDRQHARDAVAAARQAGYPVTVE